MVQQSLIREKGNLRLAGITAESIMSLLKAKHSNDVVVPECKNGETWGARDLLKLDAWVLRRTYSPLTIIGYEIKISRSDFEKDQKWTGYLELCHQFYFVCPAGLIRATDLPARVGIMWASKNRLHTKRKAERVEPDIEKLSHLLIYVLMARSQIVANMFDVGKQQEDKLQIIRQEAERAKGRKELAAFVGGHIRETYDRITELDRSMKAREQDVVRFAERLAQLGIVWDSKSDSWQDRMRVESELDLLKERIDWQTLEQMKRLSRTLADTVESIDKLRSEEGKGK